MPLPYAPSASDSSLGQINLHLQHNCPSCGFQNLAVDQRCQKCGRRLPPQQINQAPLPASDAALQQIKLAEAPAPSPVLVVMRPAIPEHVRHEIHSRVERFKARRRSQTLPLPFEEPVLADAEKIVPFPTLESEPPTKVLRSRSSRETKSCASIPDVSPLAKADENTTHEGPVLASSELESEAASVAETSGQLLAPPDPFADFPPPLASRQMTEPEAPPAQPVDLTTQVPLFEAPAEFARPQWQNFHIAGIGQRAAGIGRDLAYILGGILLFSAPVYWITGESPFSLPLLAGIGGGAVLIALLYGALFLAVFGETPGMHAAGLRLVSFSGQPASMPQRMLRVAGALVSTGSFLFGFLWAFVDEEKLYWHDHISKTVLTDSAE